MNRKTVKWFFLVLGLSASFVSIGIGRFVYNNPLADNAQFLLRLPFLLVAVTLASAIVFNWLRKIDNKSA